MSRANCPPSSVRVIVRSGAQERGAGSGFELADLAGEAGVPEAELAGGVVVKAELAGEGEEPADALLGVRACVRVPDGCGKRVGAADAGQGMGMAADAAPDRDAGLGGDVLEATLA